MSSHSALSLPPAGTPSIKKPRDCGRQNPGLTLDPICPWVPTSALPLTYLKKVWPQREPCLCPLGKQVHSGDGCSPTEGLLVRQRLEARWARKRMVSTTSIVLAWPSLFCWPGTHSKSVSLPHEIVFCKRAQQKEGNKHLAVAGGARVAPYSSRPSPLPGKKKKIKDNWRGRCQLLLELCPACVFCAFCPLCPNLALQRAYQGSWRSSEF